MWRIGWVLCVFTTVAILVAGNELVDPKTFPDFKGPYLGQTPPKNIPELFAPDLFSGKSHNKHSSLSFSPDMSEIWFSVYAKGASPQKICFTKQVKGKWSVPQLAPFSGFFKDGGPLFSPNGEQLFFYSNRPHKPSEKEKEDYDIWFATRENDSWSEPMPVGSPVNSPDEDWLRSIGEDGSLYIERMNEDRQSSYYRFQPTDSGYSKGKLLYQHNLAESKLDPFSGGDWISFREVSVPIGGGWYNSYLYASFRNPNGSFSPLRPLGDMINTGEGRFPSFSPDGKYFFFVSYRTGNAEWYWVNRDALEYLKTNDLTLVEQLSQLVLSSGFEKVDATISNWKKFYKEYYRFNEEFLFEVSIKLLDASNAPHAIECMTRNISQYPDADLSAQKLVVAAYLGQKDLLADTMASAIQSSPEKTARTASWLARKLMTTDHPDRALKILQASAKLAPESTRVLMRLADALAETGSHKEAVKVFKRVLELQPQHTGATEKLDALSNISD
ncbi:MAG: tetratricopeptide repeat protein [bacterium]|nr:tetratricopeptide repeat protein [bacterium]